MTTSNQPYAARLEIDYPERLDRLTTAFRLIWIIPIAIILGILFANGDQTVVTETGERMRTSGGGISSALTIVTALMILFRMRYPRWWFDFARELRRFSTRVGGVPCTAHRSVPIYGRRTSGSPRDRLSGR